VNRAAPAPKLVNLPEAQAEVLRSSRGVVHVWRPARGVMLSRVEGTLTVEGGLAIERTMRRVAAEEGRYTGFNDWEAMTDYDSECRTRLTRTVLDHKAYLEDVHILLSSPIVALGVKTANLVVKMLTVYTSRAPFEAALNAAMHRRPKG
jgi:hypothetical protein